MSLEQLPYQAHQEQSVTECPGSTLREARERQELDVADVAGRLKLSRQVIQHLEAGSYDRLPGDAFTRGYIRSYASLLGLDPNRMALQFDRLRGVVMERPLTGLGTQSELHARRGARLLRITSWLVLLALLTSALLWWYEKRELDAEGDDSQQLQSLEDIRIDALAMPEELHAPVSAELVTALAQIDQLELQSVPVDSRAAAVNQEILDDASAEAGSASIATEANAPEQSVEAVQVTPSDIEHLLSINFRDACWVQVSDIQGRIVHSALMQAGQQLELRHPGPLDLVLGATQAVASIHYQGQVVEYDSTRSGVTRLRVTSRNQ